MRAVLETSWQLLTETEKAALGKLSVFQGNFSAEAARQIAGCELSLLLVLCEKSLVQTVDHERFYLHGLLRDYARAYLSPTEITRLHNDFAAYYADYITNLTREIGGLRENAAAHQMALQLDNIRFTWNWLLNRQKFPQIPAFVYALFVFYENRNRLAEAIELFGDSLQYLPPNLTNQEAQTVRAVLWGYLGWFYQNTDLQKAEDYLKQSVALFATLNVALPPGPDPQLTLARVYEMRGNYTDALALATGAAKEAHARQDAYNEAFALYLTGRIFYSQGNYTQAKEYVKTAYYLYKKIESLGSIIGCLNMLAAVARAQGNFLEAGEYAAESLEIGQKLDDKHSMGASLASLAACAYEEGDYGRAREMYRQSFDLLEEVGNTVNTPLALEGVGKACLGLGDYTDAARYLLQGLQLAVAVSNQVAITNCVSTFGALLVKIGQPEAATTLLGFIRQHPATLRGRRENADALLLECAGKLPPELYRTELASGQTGSLENIVAMVKHYHRLTPQTTTYTLGGAPVKGQKLLAVPASALASEWDEELLEALTSREMEVLALLEAGATNGQIAEKLYLSVGTVKTHNYNIFSKLGVKNRVQAINRAKVLKLLPEA
jgi:DNA-binding CsgD family transcriptional regulator